MATNTKQPVNADEPIITGDEQSSVSNTSEPDNTVSISVEPSSTGTSTSDNTGTRPRRGRPPKVTIEGEQESKEKTTRSRKTKTIGKENAKEIVTFLSQFTQVTVSSALKVDASFTPAEQSFIEPSLINIVADMKPHSYEMASKFINPIMLFTGLMLWGTRLYNETSMRQQQTETFTNTETNEVVNNTISDILEQSWNGNS